MPRRARRAAPRGEAEGARGRLGDYSTQVVVQVFDTQDRRAKKGDETNRPRAAVCAECNDRNSEQGLGRSLGAIPNPS